MLKEYIESLYDSNKEKLEELEKQLQKLMNDLVCAEEWLETVQKEQNTDQNIFSPRRRADGGHEKVDAAQMNLDSIKQKIEYVREKIEDSVKKKYEIENLLEEAETVIDTRAEISEKNKMYEGQENKSENEAEARVEVETEIQEETEKKIEKEVEIENEMQAEQIKTGKEMHEEIKKKADSIDERTTDGKSRDQADKQNQGIDTEKQLKERFRQTLSELYKKTELSMALLNGNKSVCKNELKSMKIMIKKYAEELDNI